MTKRILKLIIYLLPFILLGWLLNKHFAPIGTLEISWNFKKASPFISYFYPEERISPLQREDNKYFHYLESDLVYFDLRMPRVYKKAIVKIKYQNEDQPIFEIGARKSKDEWIFERKPLEAKTIDDLDWNRTEKDGIVFLQKEKKYSSLENFRNNFLKNNEKTAVYFYDDLKKNLKIEDYQKSDNLLEINRALRGKHEIYTYIKEEPLDFTFSFSELNRKEGSDEFTIRAYDEKNNEIYQAQVADDGITEAKGERSEIKEKHIAVPNLREGVYRIKLEANDDVLIEKIKTAQHLVVFKNRFFLASSEEYLGDKASNLGAETIYTSAKELKIKVPHKENLQTIKINGQDLKIEKFNKVYEIGEEYLFPGKLNSIFISKNDVLFEASEGSYFTFSLDNFFYPEPKNIVDLKAETDLEKEQIEFIVARYTPPQKENIWKEASAEFDLEGIYIDQDNDNTLQFMLSIPGLEKNERTIKINAIEIILKKDPITWSNLIPRLKNFISRLKQ